MQIVALLIQLSSTAQAAKAALIVVSPSASPTVQKKVWKDEPAKCDTVEDPSKEVRPEWMASYVDKIVQQVVESKTNDASAAMRTDAGITDNEAGASPAISLQLRDALQVLLSFSKQSMKEPLPGQPERQFLRSKRISLDMVFCMLDTADEVFMSNEHSVRIMTQTLLLALVKNSVSSLPDVFDQSLKIFGILVTKCRRHIKREIGVFVTQVLLQIISSGNSTYQHKQTALQCMLRMMSDAAIAIELFVNFDCDVESDNVFEIITERLSQIAQGKYAASEHTSLIDPQQESELKILALKTLVTLSGSLADWADRYPEGAPNDDDALASIMARRKRKIALKTAVEKFNVKPKKGMIELKEAGFITDDPSSLASLIRKDATGLDMTMVGDYLGEPKDFNQAVLQAIIDSTDFKDLGVDAALRKLLGCFRLPGEAQKIDRVIDMFSKKYFADNPGVFANSDTAHILAFSVIMLQTDLHSEQIKNKMTKAAFVSNNRGIDDGKNLPQEYLEGLYDSIAENPFSLKEDDDARQRLASQQAQTAAEKLQLFVKETEVIVRNAQTILQTSVERSEVHYVPARVSEHASPTFGVACWPLLAAFTTVLQDVDEKTESSLMELSVEGLRLCARVAARFEMHTKRDAVVSAIAMFTYLMTLKEIKQKNVECIKALLNIALSDGGRLGASWQHILQCLSRLEQLQLISDKARPDFLYFHVEAGGASASAPPSASGRSVGAAGITTLLSTGMSDDQVEQANSASVMSQIDSALIDRLFNKTVALDGTALVGFVVQLVRVSREELAAPDKPRVFSLHKLVEVADYNMERDKDVWLQIWDPLSQHLVEVASHPNANVSMYALDSLRQIATRILGKDDANFVAEAMLRPFEVMMFSTRSMSKESKSYVVDAVLNIVQQSTHRIKSGWKVVLRILAAVSRAIADEEGVQRGFTAIKTGLRYQVLLDDHFQETVDTIYAFATCQSSVTTSMEAIMFLNQAADHASASSGSSAVEVSEEKPQKTDRGTRLFSILKCLVDSVEDPRQDVRTSSLNTLFEILSKHHAFIGGDGGCGWPVVLSDTLEPLFKGLQDHLKLGSADPNAATTSTLYAAALKALSKLFEVSLAAWPSSGLERALPLIERSVHAEGEASATSPVVNAATDCLRKLVSLASEQKSLPEASSAIIDDFNKRLLQNGGDA